MKKRVLLVSPSSLNNGGVQFVFMTIIRNLYKDYDFDVIVFNNYQNFYKNEFLSFGGKIFSINVSYFSFFKKAINKIFYRLKLKIRASKIIKRGKYDIIHCFYQFNSDIFLKRAYKVGIKNRICRSGVCSKKENRIKEFNKRIKRKRIIKYSTSLTGVSEEACRSLYGEKVNYEVINNPCDESIVFNSKTPLLLNLTQIGNFTNNKNFIFTLKVVNELTKKCNCTLFIVCNEIPSSFKQEIANLNLSKYVKIFPNDYDKNKIFPLTSYLILPSLSEAFGNVLIEAQNAGVKCFASDTISRHANCGGVVYLPLNKGPEYWAEIIYEEFCKNHGTKQKYDCSRFTTKTFIKNINALYLKH